MATVDVIAPAAAISSEPVKIAEVAKVDTAVAAKPSVIDNASGKRFLGKWQMMETLGSGGFST